MVIKNDTQFLERQWQLVGLQKLGEGFDNVKIGKIHKMKFVMCEAVI